MDVDVDYLHAQLGRLLTVDAMPGLDGVIDRVVAVLTAEERKRGRRRIRPPGATDAAAYQWRHADPVPPLGKAAGKAKAPAVQDNESDDGFATPPEQPSPRGDEAEGPCGLLRKAFAECQEDRVFQAMECLTLAEMKAAALAPGSAAREEYEAAAARMEYTSREIRRKHRMARQVAEECRDEKGWRKLGCSAGVTTYYKKEGGGWHTSRFDGVIEAPAFHLIALLREVDLWTSWIPSVLGFGLQSGFALAAPFRTNIQAGAEVRLPWPLSNRDCAFDIECVDCLACPSKDVVLLFKDCADPPAAKPGTVRLNIEDSGCIVTPYYDADPYKTHCAFLLRLDVKMEVIPDWIMNAVFNNLNVLIIKQIRAAVEVVKERAWSERYCHPRSPFYGWLRGRIEQDLPEQSVSLPPVGAGRAFRATPLKGIDKILMRETVTRAALAAALHVVVAL
eukprot:TRINITY_DN27972_c0_g1_i1.p1 TRINITY_DN27972_c0_g1~~TRINITY_DN27972_c0_g1_i1.p1  ORF type:complete len:449 (+),score=154.68 TRINITY_DN27972_c0_g1_i1:154-1500(+)